MVTLIVTFTVVAPDTSLTRSLAALALGAVLLVSVVTSDYHPTTRRVVAGLIAGGIIGLSAVVLYGDDLAWLASALGGALVLAILVELVRGLVAMLSSGGGVTAQTVAGGLSIYLLIGLMFAMIIGTISGLSSEPYFVGGGDKVTSDHVYFSFTTLTTTGFGDPVPAHRAGKSLAVLEMLIGQIYLVTVIALLVSRARGRE